MGHLAVNYMYNKDTGLAAARNHDNTAPFFCQIRYQIGTTWDFIYINNCFLVPFCKQRFSPLRKKTQQENMELQAKISAFEEENTKLKKDVSNVIKEVAW